MSRATVLAGTIVGTALLLCLTFAGFVTAQTPSASPLTGKVTSQAEGAMEGVIVGAKKVGSTITTWVVSNAQGQYSFPRERLEPGNYAISIRAVGYELPKTSVNVTAQQPAQMDLQLNKVTSASKLAMQLSNAEWLMSVPGSPEQRLLGGCVNCHTLQRVLFSRFSADEMAQVIQRMAMHTNNSSP